MHPLSAIFLLVLSFSLAGCVPSPYSDESFFSPVKHVPQKLRGTIVDGRYCSEDRSFSVIAHQAPNGKTEIIERKTEDSLTVIFDTTDTDQTIRYDVIPLTDKQFCKYVFCDAEVKEGGFKIFLDEVVIPAYNVAYAKMKVTCEEVVLINDEIAYFAMIHGPISTMIDYSTFERTDNFCGILMTVKGQHFIVINLMQSLPSSCGNRSEVAREQLLPSLLQLRAEYSAEEAITP
jgi:hypothetical protein